MNFTSRILHELSQRCITKLECSQINHVVFENECIRNCPPKYKSVRSVKTKFRECQLCESECPRICDGKEIKYLTDAEKFQGCTIINGSLHIKINIDLPNLDTELENYLGDIEIIQDNLKVYRSISLSSLSFLRSLSSIEGRSLENDKYSVMIYENPNLQSLWSWESKRSMDIGNGIFFFHLNHNLCMTEIEAFQKISNHTNSMDYIRQDTNGQPLTCDKKNILKSHYNVLSSTTVTIVWNDYVFKNWTNFDYIIYYIEAPKNDITTHYGIYTCTK